MERRLGHEKLPDRKSAHHATSRSSSGSQAFYNAQCDDVYSEKEDNSHAASCGMLHGIPSRPRALQMAMAGDFPRQDTPFLSVSASLSLAPLMQYRHAVLCPCRSAMDDTCPTENTPLQIMRGFSPVPQNIHHQQCIRIPDGSSTLLIN